tara:strand:+ start:32 stop:220 length:189 start_codon:yes stop_codon:yes gene_type:complete
MKKIIKEVLKEHFSDNPKLRNLSNEEWYINNIATEIITKFREDGWFLDLSDKDLMSSSGKTE